MKKLMSFVWICLMSISMLSAQGVEEVTLVVSGDGATKEEATHVALRSAIEQAFGCFVSANTEILNDSVVKDEIVTVSNGSISSYEEINVTELDSALLSVTLRATVSVNKLISYAQSKGSSCELSGALLTQEKRMLEMNIANTKKALNHLFTLVNEFVEKNDICTYTLDVENVKMNGYVTAKVTGRRNENGDNLEKMINDYLSAISIDKEQVQHLEKIGFSVPHIYHDNCCSPYRDRIYATYVDLSCVSKELRQSIQKNIDRRTLILFRDNLGFVYPVINSLHFNKFFRLENSFTISYGSFTESSASEVIHLQIPDQNIVALSNIEIVPFSNPRFRGLVDSVWNQAIEYAKQKMVNKRLEDFSNEDSYYYICKMGLFFSLQNTYVDYKQFREDNSEETIKYIDSSTINYWTELADKRYRRYNNSGLKNVLDCAVDTQNELSEILEQLTKGENLYRSSWEPKWDEDYFANRSTISE